MAARTVFRVVSRIFCWQYVESRTVAVFSELEAALQQLSSIPERSYVKEERMGDKFEERGVIYQLIDGHPAKVCWKNGTEPFIRYYLEIIPLDARRCWLYRDFLGGIHSLADKRPASQDVQAILSAFDGSVYLEVIDVCLRSKL